MQNSEKKNIIDNILSSCPIVPNLTNSTHLELIIETVDTLLNYYKSKVELEALEVRLNKSNSNAFILLSIKIAISKLVVAETSNNIFISVVFAVYKEQNRIKKSEEHPYGEDFLLRKINQLNYLFNKQKNIKWELLLVDDGCPFDSGKIAQEIINKNNIAKNVKVLFLKDAINEKLSVINPLTSTNESQKGGSIAYGMWHAAKYSSYKNHIILFTDADLSTHLGQIGLLLEPILFNGKNIAIGSRREPTSVVVKQGVRNNRGKLFIYLWKRLIPNLFYITDTQCGFKAFRKEMLIAIIDDMIEKKFAFDIELLLKAELITQNSIAKVPIAWIDSEAASTTTDIQPYLSMLKTIAKMYKKYLPFNETSESFANLILSMNENEFHKLIKNIPNEIKRKKATEFAKYDKISASYLKQIIS